MFKKIFAATLATMALVAGQLVASSPANAMYIEFTCQQGYVCIWQCNNCHEGIGWDLELKYYRYGTYNLSNQYGRHLVKNSQTQGAAFWLCRGYNGVDCTLGIWPSDAQQVDLTPYNSVKLTPPR